MCGGSLDCMSHARIFRYFKTSPEIIRLAVMLYVRYPLSLRNVEDLLHERGIDITHETIRFWWRHCQIKIGVADDWIGVVRSKCRVASALPTSEGGAVRGKSACRRGG
jgi:transposase-like protein